MPFGFDDIAFILAALSSANSLANPPTTPDSPAAAPPGSTPGQAAESLFGVPPVASKAPGAVDLSGLTDAIEPAIQQLAALGPAPTVPLQAPNIPVPQVQLPPLPGQQPTVPQGPVPPPPGTVGPPPPPPPPKGKGVGAVLAEIPEALDSVAGLLGIGQPQARDIPAPAAGGPQGQVVPGFNLPPGITIADILSQIPRFR